MTQALWSFLGANARHSLLEAMSEQDRQALNAFAELCRLYKVADTAGRGAALVAMAAAASAMQGDTRPVCRWAIAHVLDWADVDPLWKQVESAERRPDPLLQKMFDDVVASRTPPKPQGPDVVLVKDGDMPARSKKRRSR